MFKYDLWGMTIVSDIELNLECSKTKRALLMAKAQIDKTGIFADRINIKNNRIQVISMSNDVYEDDFVIEK